jgi:hypothetical protein
MADKVYPLSHFTQPKKKVTSLSDFLRREQVTAALKLYRTAPAGTFAQRCADEIISPNIEEINLRLGQENDPKYLAYLVEYVFQSTKGRK